MGSIKIIDRINITGDGLKHSRLGSDVFLHQGDIDGACAVYSLMMDLVIIDAINMFLQLPCQTICGHGTFSTNQNA